LRLSIETSLLLCALALPRPVVGQEVAPPGLAPTTIEGRSPQWEPLGQLPVDQAGAGRRGYAVPGESTEVAAPGTDRIAIHTVAANNFYREQNDDFLITQRFETHTLALDYRRGFKVGVFPRFELGAQIQLSERDGGFLNGFISGFEGLSLSLSGKESAKNMLRTSAGTAPPLGTVITKDGGLLYQGAGSGSGIGDFSVVAKALLRDGDPSSSTTRVAARVAVNVSGTSEFAEGNFVGAGVSMDKKLLNWAAIHSDVRANLALDRMSQWNLPLKRLSFGFSAGPEFRLARNTSASAQIDGSTTPYLPTGTLAFDKGYGSITLGVGHRFRAGRTAIVSQVYARENMNLPFRVRWNTDPDMSLGIKITIRPASH
jgi:hypothetical protein